MSDDGKTFDPSQHLTKVKGSDYLECKWRIAWFRDEWPAGRIVTELVHHAGSMAVFRAEVTKLETDGTICGSATGFGSCTEQEFRSYLEKAETKALGRALAALGFGTQFADDFADGDGIADAPVQRSGGNDRNHQPTPFRDAGGQRSVQNPEAEASEKQISMIYGKAKALRWSNDALYDYLQETFNAPNPFGPEELRKGDASTVIDDLQARLDASR